MLLVAALLLASHSSARAPQSILVLQWPETEGGQYPIRLYVPSTKKERRINQAGDINALEDFQWSPDAKHFAYSLRVRGDSTVHVENTETGKWQAIDPGSGKGIAWLNSETLAFKLSEGREVRHSITSSKRSIQEATPEKGARKRFSIEADSGPTNAIGLRDLATGKFIDLAEAAEGTEITWAPDNQEVLVSDETLGRLFLYNPTTRKRTSLDSLRGRRHYYGWIAWSPTARYLAYNGPRGLTVLDMKTKSKKTSKINAWCTGWSRDEKLLYFAESLYDGQSGMALYQVDKSLKHRRRVSMLSRIARIKVSP